MDRGADVSEETKLQISEHERSVAVIINHCNEMKRRDCVSRFSLGFLFISCAAFLLFYHATQREPSDHQTAAQVSPGPSQQMASLTASPKRSMPKAHLTAKMETTAKLENILPWESNLGNAFTDSGFAYTDNALLIPESGRYFVYAQVTFRALMHDHVRRGCEPVRLSQTISKMTNGYPKPSDLITSFKTVECGSDTWMKSLYSGAVFLLEKGDKLMVFVNNITLVDFTDEKKTFFGAYLL